MSKQDSDLGNAIIGCGIMLYFLQMLRWFIIQVFKRVFYYAFVWNREKWYKLIMLRNPGKGGVGAKLLATILMFLTLALAIILVLIVVNSISPGTVQAGNDTLFLCMMLFSSSIVLLLLLQAIVRKQAVVIAGMMVILIAILVTSFLMGLLPIYSTTNIPSPVAKTTDGQPIIPTANPMVIPTDTPTAAPTDTPTAAPTDTPTAIPTDTPTATPTTPSDISYTQATSGTPVLNDPLSDNSAGNSWNVDDNCGFIGGEYHVTINQNGNLEACFAAPTFQDFAFQVQMTILTGDGGGIVFRTGGENTFGYRFFLGLNYFNLDYGSAQLAGSSSFKANLNQTYLLTAIVYGSTISLYIDKQLVTTVEDSSASSGGIGLMAVDFSNNADVAFSNAQVWNL